MEVRERDHFEVIGVMSGSSLDGLDLAWAELVHDVGDWSFNIREARTVPYDRHFQQRLKDAMHGSALELARLDRDLGDLIGSACTELLAGRKVDVIASHGHTLFHKPEDGLTTQIGSGARIAARTGTTTVCDFRSVDVALGGQGAPLVPLGERLLFPHHKAFLNIGGICNIALHGAERVTGYDVCIGNQALNFLASEGGLAYDEGGTMARSGRIVPELLETLNALPVHHPAPPRSLGREWFDEQVKPVIDRSELPLTERLATVVEHIAQQLAAALAFADGPVLVTGGGAHNAFLLERMRSQCATPIEVPDRLTVDYKEALVFALLGVLRVRGEANTLSSVTGAQRDSTGGAVYHPY
ncbi:MAG: anhydro-N-acetylmuramic acid kinase [Flavobacteriales bacterium]